MSDWNVSETDDLLIVLLLMIWKRVCFTCFNSLIILKQDTPFSMMRTPNSAGGTKDEMIQTAVNRQIVNCK